MHAEGMLSVQVQPVCAEHALCEVFEAQLRDRPPHARPDQAQPAAVEHESLGRDAQEIDVPAQPPFSNHVQPAWLTQSVAEKKAPHESGGVAMVLSRQEPIVPSAVHPETALQSKADDP